MAEINLEKVYLQRFSAISDGMHLEICQADVAGKKATDAALEPLITIRADEGDDLKFVIYTDFAGAISIPLSEIERAIAIAKQEVHSEDFYPFSDD